MKDDALSFHEDCFSEMQIICITSVYQKQIEHIFAPTGYKFSGELEIPELDDVFLNLNGAAQRGIKNPTQAIHNYRLLLVAEAPLEPLGHYLEKVCESNGKVVVSGVVPKEVWEKERKK